MKCGAEELLPHAGRNVKWNKHLGKLQLAIFIPYDPGHHFLGLKLEKRVHKSTTKQISVISNVDNSFVSNCPKLEATLSINRGMEK